MMLRFRIIGILIAVIALSRLHAYGQEFEVVSFDSDRTDLTARTQPRIDGNGRKCALLKVYVDDEIAEVRGGVVGDVKSVGMEKQIYMAHDSKQVEIIFSHHFPLRIKFDDYNVPVVTEQTVYVLKLKESVATGSQAVDNSQIFEAAEEQPEYPGGEEQLVKDLNQRLLYPPSAMESGTMGKVILRFVVMKDGSVGMIKVARSSFYQIRQTQDKRGKWKEEKIILPYGDQTLEQSAIEAVRKLNKFYPGKINGQPVNVWYTVPVNFKLM